MVCALLLNKHSELFDFVIISFGCKSAFFDSLWLSNLVLVWANKYSCMKPVKSKQSLSAIKFAASSEFPCSIRSCFSKLRGNISGCRTQVPLQFHSFINPIRVKALTVFVTKLHYDKYY